MLARTSIDFATLYACQVKVIVPTTNKSTCIKYDVVLYRDSMCERFEKRIFWWDNPPSINDSVIIVKDRKYNLKWVGYYER